VPFLGESQIGHTEFPADTFEVKPGRFKATKFRDGLDPLALAVELACRSMVAPKGPCWYVTYTPYLWSPKTWAYLVQTADEWDEDVTIEEFYAN